ncbi:Hypothetical protein NTJ_10500 [Nesidiocoris tenuis]|uniref:Uncharacterized protein n=1 Tax=Nesidiocoris tenuis TaxID=355587 RepID=A0ABN7AZU4_9HEMI|nr:Hypothetical protein NTJ_10500 [Nesidiocoris tenuis]
MAVPSPTSTARSIKILVLIQVFTKIENAYPEIRHLFPLEVGPETSLIARWLEMVGSGRTPGSSAIYLEEVVMRRDMIRPLSPHSGSWQRTNSFLDSRPFSN